MKLSTKLFRRRSYRWGVVCFLMCFLFFNASVSIVTAGPEGAQVVNGQVTIQQSSNNTAITASDKAIINYSSFDIAQPETVRFIQPGSTASVLNRILSANPTNINGTLLANGRVFFVNPAGVYFGNGATINVNQLVASGLNMSNADFINGRYNFAGGNGAVINNGDISAQQVYLIGKQVTNSGNISCPAGYVVMAAGDRVFLGEPGSDIVLDVEGTSLSESANAAAPEVGVLNEGTIDAAGGIIALAAAGDIYSQAISNVGSLSTSADASDAGQIKLTAAEGTVINSGSIEAKSSSGTGGNVQMLGDKVGLFDAAEIDVSGSNGGGTVLVGGDYQGKGDVLTASRTYIGPDSSIKADATENGDGGKVIVWADEITRFYGDISARGGSEGGDGGFVEVSGKENLGFYGYVDTLAPQGNIGTLLLDPLDIEVVTGGGLDLTDVDAFADGGSNPNVSQIDPVTINAATTNVDLQAENSITVTDSINMSNDNVGIIARAGDYISVDAPITTRGGILDFTANDSGGAQSDTGYIDLNAALDTTGGGLTGGAVTLTVDGGTGDIQLGDNITTNTANITFEGPVTLTADSELSTTAGVGGDISFDSDVSGNQLLTLAAGTGNIDFLSTVGGTTPLSGLLVNSAATVDLDNTVALDDEGLDITAGAIVIDDTVSITNGGSFATSGATFDNTGGTITTDGGSVTLNHTGVVTVGANVDTSVGAGGAISINGSSINLNEQLIADNADISVTAGGGIQVDNDTDAEIITNGSVNLTANAISSSGAHDLKLDGATALTVVDTGAGDIDIIFSNGDIVDIDDGHVLNDIALDQVDSSSFSYRATAGDITIGTIDATGTVTVEATTGSIDDASANPDTTTDITASSIELNAATGIGATAHLELAGGTIKADTTNGAIDLDSLATAGVTVTSLTTDTGSIQFDQTGDQTLDVDLATTTNGAITLTNDNADLTATIVTAGGSNNIQLTTTTGGDVLLGAVNAADNQVTVTSAAAIEDDGTNDGAAEIVAATIDLNAAAGIGAGNSFDVTGTSISADSTTGAINLDSLATAGVTVTSLTTGTGSIQFDQTGDQTLDVDLATTTNGAITLTNDNADLTATIVTAGGNNDIQLTTTTAGNLDVGSLTAGNAISLEAAGAITQSAGTITTNGGSLSMKSNGNLSMSNYTVANPGLTDLILDSTGGSVIVANSAADNWQSISAAAKYDVLLSGDGDITTGDLESLFASSGVRIFTDTGSGGSLIAQGTINSLGYVEVDVEGTASFADTVTAGGNIELEAVSDLEINDSLTATGGGVSLISETGKIYTPGGANDTLNVTITGNSTSGVGVDLDPDKPGSGEAAIVIRTKEDLILGSNAQLIANGQYDPQQNDDRYAVGFDDSISGGGDQIDVAIYLRSYRTDAVGDPIGNVAVNSKVTMADNGTMVVDAGETVTFEEKFNESVFDVSNRLEVVSRRSETLDEVITNKRLPFADNPEAIRDWFNQTSTGYFAGAYVLRGVKTLLAEVLALTNPVPLVPPRPLEPELRGEVEGPDTEALAKLLSDLGIGVQPYMTEAYADSLSTDLRLYKAAEKLQELMPVLEDVNGIHIAGLRETVAEYFPTLDVLSDERMDSFAQVLASHKGDETNYDLAGQCIFALTEYVNILGTDIGWPVETSVEFVMGRYVPRITENDEIRIAVIQMHLQKEL